MPAVVRRTEGGGHTGVVRTLIILVHKESSSPHFPEASVIAELPLCENGPESCVGRFHPKFHGEIARPEVACFRAKRNFVIDSVKLKGLAYAPGRKNQIPGHGPMSVACEILRVTVSRP